MEEKETTNENATNSKLYYTIGEVAKKFNVNTSLIRFWEKEFPSIKPKKNAKGNRLFTQKDIDTFSHIYYLIKECGMTLKGAKEKLKVKTEESQSDYEAVKILKNIRSMIEDLKNTLESAETQKN